MLKLNNELYKNKKISSDYRLLNEMFVEVNIVKRHLETDCDNCPLEGTKVLDRALERIFQIIVDGVINIAKHYVKVILDEDSKYQEPKSNEIFDTIIGILGKDISEKFKNDFIKTRNDIVHLRNIMNIQNILDDVNSLILCTRTFQEKICFATPCPNCSSIIHVNNNVKIGAKLFCEFCQTYVLAEQLSPLILRPNIEQGLDG